MNDFAEIAGSFHVGNRGSLQAHIILEETFIGSTFFSLLNCQLIQGQAKPGDIMSVIAIYKNESKRR
ncbi:MAG: hypothetical protein ETSY2_49640 [Candidatus Entotheonella gemina]|uniref:Uncharacterized protein n=1 Tax=Candidatus Entotheonella gemina TaxID=1429439 RepID=W4L8W4_9BACT|nr:MAG: hypothetical protein ETSY2_49640 [Candidatus Entotheonella gemina]